MSVRVGRQLQIDEDIQGHDDEQLLSLVWMGLIQLDRWPNDDLRRRLEMFRLEVERRGLLSDEMMQHFVSRLAR